MRPGLLSTLGWGVLDDSHTGRFVPAPDSPGGMPTWWTLDSIDALDVYFAAYPGLDFKAGLAAWASVLGRAPMLPRSAFGVWWSRYWEYNQTSIVDEVLSGYANYSIPLNTLVLGEGLQPTLATPLIPWHAAAPLSIPWRTWLSIFPLPHALPANRHGLAQ
jgi:hypothetical protein